MQTPWSTGVVRFVWVNGNVDETGLWESLRMWSDRSGILYVRATSLADAQIVVVDPDEYSAAFGVTGFVGHATLITDDATGLGRICYITLRDDVGPVWQRTAAWAHEAGHAEGETDRPTATGTIYSYTDVQDEPSASDAARWIESFGPSEASGRFALERGGAGGGDDTVWGTDGANLIYGNQGADHLSGLGGADTLYGGQDGDVMSGDQGGDVLYGNRGGDVLSGGAGNDTLFGGQEADLLVGGDGANVLVPGLGADTIHADGNDIVVGYEPEVDILILIGQAAPTFAEYLA